jgi:hypothetical protein
VRLIRGSTLPKGAESLRPFLMLIPAT